MPDFGELSPEGKLTNVRTIDKSDLLACPHVILVPDHYRANGSCRCDDEQHVEMREWGYSWDATTRRWI